MLRPDPDKIIVPRKHGQVLIEPELGRLADVLQHPVASKVASRLPENGRVLARAEFLAAARKWGQLIGDEGIPADAAEKPWAITGHQLEFYHAGVWAKVLAVDALAKRTNCVAFDLLVDHDVVEEYGFEAPLRGEKGWLRKLVEVLPSSPLPVEMTKAPSMEAFEKWDAALARFEATHTDSMAFMLSVLRAEIGKADGKDLSYTQWLAAGRASFERSLGLRVHHIPTTWACKGAMWEWFVGEWIRNADAWTAVYNRQLAEYRKRQGIKGTQHPMPDLARHVDGKAGTFELPFWIYREGEVRERLVIRKTAEGVVILFGGAESGEIRVAADFTMDGLHIRPRALTLTMFVRLFLSDVFIHGIGGALYDQITDGILEEVFGDVPAYGCVSAAWLLPLGQAVVDEDLPGLRWRKHHIEHNPQLALDPFTALRTDVAELITERKNLVVAIGESLAKARNDVSQRAKRREWFERLHAVNQELHGKSPRILAKLEQQIRDAEYAEQQNKVLQWREWFFGLHGVASLEKLRVAVCGGKCVDVSQIDPQVQG